MEKLNGICRRPFNCIAFALLVLSGCGEKAPESEASESSGARQEVAGADAAVDSTVSGAKPTTQPSQASSAEMTAAIQANLDRLGTAFDQLMQETGLVSAKFEDLVGQGKYVPALQTVDGETYQQEFHADGNISARLADGTVVYLYDRKISVGDASRVVANIEEHPRVHELLANYVQQNGSVAALFMSKLRGSRGWDCYEIQSPEFVYRELPISEAQRLNFGNSYVKEKVEIYMTSYRVKHAESEKWDMWEPEQVVRGRLPLFVIEVEGHKGAESWEITRMDSLSGGMPAAFGVFDVVKPKRLSGVECRSILSPYVEINNSQGSVHVQESERMQLYNKKWDAFTYELNKIDFKGEEIALSPSHEREFGIKHRKLIRIYCSSYRYRNQETDELSMWLDGTDPEILAVHGPRPLFKMYVEDRADGQVVYGTRYVEGRDDRDCKFTELASHVEVSTPESAGSTDVQKETAQVVKDMNPRALELLREANQFKEQGDLETMKSRLAMAVLNDEENPDVYHQSAVLLHGGGLLEDAEMFLTSGVEKFPKNALLHYSLGLLYAEMEDMDKTVESLETAVELNPLHARAWYNLSIAYAKLERFEDSDRALEAARKARGEVSNEEVSAPPEEKVPEALADIIGILDQPMTPLKIGSNWPDGRYVLLAQENDGVYSNRSKNVITVKGRSFTYDMYTCETFTADEGSVKAGDYASHKRFTGIVTHANSNRIKIKLSTEERLSCYPEGHLPVGLLKNKWPMFQDTWTFMRQGDYIHDARNRSSLFQFVE
ncbi:MAG: tetratricopeptide repeat protein [Coraliomargaritaceae bacterium]